METYFLFSNAGSQVWQAVALKSNPTSKVANCEKVFRKKVVGQATSGGWFPVVVSVLLSGWCAKFRNQGILPTSSCTWG